MSYDAEIIADSIGPNGARVTSFEPTMPAHRIGGIQYASDVLPERSLIARNPGGEAIEAN